MSFAIPVDYLGGHPEFDSPTSDGRLRIDRDSAVLTFLASERVSANPVVLAEQAVERFVIPVADLYAVHLERDQEPGLDLLFGSLRDIFFGGQALEVDDDTPRDARLILGAQLARHRCRLLFLASEAHGQELLVRLDARRSGLGLAALGDSFDVPSQQDNVVLASVLRHIGQRLDAHEQALELIIRRLGM